MNIVVETVEVGRFVKTSIVKFNFERNESDKKMNQQTVNLEKV